MDQHHLLGGQQAALQVRSPSVCIVVVGAAGLRHYSQQLNSLQQFGTSQLHADSRHWKQQQSEDRTSDIRTVSYIQETHTTERRRGIINTPEKFRNFENDRIRLEASNEEIYYKMFGEREEEVTHALSPQSYKKKIERERERERESVCVCVCVRARNPEEKETGITACFCVLFLWSFSSPFTMPQIWHLYSYKTNQRTFNAIIIYHRCKSKIAPWARCRPLQRERAGKLEACPPFAHTERWKARSAARAQTEKQLLLPGRSPIPITILPQSRLTSSVLMTSGKLLALGGFS